MATNEAPLADTVDSRIPEPGPGEAKNSTVDRALMVLEAFLSADEDMSLAELSRVLELDKSVIHRILATLVRRAFLEQDSETKRYRVGLRSWEIGQQYLSMSSLEELALEAISEVVRHHQYATGYVATLEADQAVILSSVRGAGPVNILIDPGTRLPAAVTATGRVMLAHLGDARMQRLREGLATQRREGATQRVHDLDTELEQVRERGYAENRGEYFPGIGTIAVCVHNAERGSGVAAISVDFPIAPETEHLWDELPIQLREALASLGKVLAAPVVPAT